MNFNKKLPYTLIHNSEPVELITLRIYIQIKLFKNFI